MTLLKEVNAKNINISLLSLEARIKELENFIDVDDIKQQIDILSNKINELEYESSEDVIEEINELNRKVSTLQASIDTEKNDRQIADNALQIEINNKVDKENGKGLSTNDFTDADKTKLNGIDASLDNIKKDNGYLCKLYSGIASSTSDSTTQSYNVMLLGKIPDPASTAAPGTPSSSWDIDIDVYFVRPQGHKAAWCNVKAGYGYSNAWRKYGKIETFGIDSENNNKNFFELVTLKYNNEWYTGIKHFVDIDGVYSARINNINIQGAGNPSTVENTSLSNVLTIIPYKKNNNTVLNSEINSSIAEFSDTYAPTIRRNGRQIINGLNIKSTTDVSLTSFGIEPLSIGISTGVNLGIDINEIQARNNSATSTLYLNGEGGETHIGTSGVFSSNGLSYNGTSARATSDGNGSNIASTYSKLAITALWSGTSSTGAQTLTLNSSYSNYKFILVVGSLYSNPTSLRMSILIPAFLCGAGTAANSDDFLLEGGTENTMRRIRFRFTSTTKLYKLASDGSSSHLPVILGVYGIK